MIINELLAKNNITPYRLSKISGVAYTTLNDIISGKTKLEKCSAGTVYHLAQALKVSMEDLLGAVNETSIKSRQNFETFKSNVQHRVKDNGDINFVIETIESDVIRKYFDMRWYPEALYLLAMVDYLSRENKLPLYQNYNDIRSAKLRSPIFPSSINAMAVAENNEQIKTKAIKHAIPEFLKFNIIESEIHNVV